MTTHVLTTRPLEKSTELAQMLEPLGVKVLVQPAFKYTRRSLADHQADELGALSEAGSQALVIFTSPRAVWYGLEQLPADALWQARKAAIGPATAHALKKAGVRVDVVPTRGYTSESLLQTLAESDVRYSRAYIVAAPGGREKLTERLSGHCSSVQTLLAYQSVPAELDPEVLRQLNEVDGMVTVWTSANAMKSLSQRMPPAAWYRVCQSDWLVISDRLLRLARAYGPPRVHVSEGPGNLDLVHSIRKLI